MQAVMSRVERVAASETRVCILGETGTGKELIARTIQRSNTYGPYKRQTQRQIRSDKNVR